MSRLAQSVQREVGEMRKTKAPRAARRHAAADDGETGIPDVGDVGEVGGEREGVEDATEQLLADTPAASESTTTTTTTTKGRSMAKKAKGAKKKAAAPKKANGAVKATRQPRTKVLASGSIKSVEASGDTYLVLKFDEGQITLTPTGNRAANRDIAAKAIRALLK